MLKKRLAAILVAACAIPALAAAADKFPSRAVTVIVPYGAGGGTDATARAVARALSEHWGQPVVVENVGGADGLIGTQKAARADADGYTVLFSVPNLLLFKHLKSSKFDATSQLDAVSLVAYYPVVVTASKASGLQTLADLKKKCAPGAKGNCSIGTGEQFSWLAGRAFLDAAGVEATDIPYRGNAPMVNDVLGGHVMLGIGAVGPVLPHYKAGAMQVLTSLEPQRIPSVPDVPTMTEAGLSAPAVGRPWYGLFAPRGMPPERLAEWEKALQAAARDKGVADSLALINAVPTFSSAKTFAGQVSQDEKSFDALLAKYPLPQ